VKYKDVILYRIIEIEKSLKKMQKTIATTGSKLTQARYRVNFKTYLLNINIFNSMPGETYEAQVEELK